jgi:hypothetical protein
MKTRVRKAVVLVNSLGAAGYLFLALAWVMFAMAALWLIVQSSITTLPVDMATQPSSSVATTNNTATQIVTYSIGLVVVVVMVAFIISLPYLIGKWGSRVVRKLLRYFSITPGLRHVFLAKSLLAMVPLIGFVVIALRGEPADIALPLLHIISIVMSVAALGCFLLQLWAARVLSLPAKDVW